MKVLLLHNRRLTHTGEDSVVDAMAELFRQHGDDLVLWTKDNSSLRRGLTAKLHAFFAGIYSRSAAAEMRAMLSQERPDVVHVHNIYPFFSPSVFRPCQEAGVPVHFHCHSFQFTCPTTFQFRDGAPCFKCVGGNEHWCVIHNCKQSWSASVGYALRNVFARRWKLFAELSSIIVPSAYLQQHFVRAGFREEQISVLPNLVEIPAEPAAPAAGKYAAFIGRLSIEKGLDVLVQAAALAPDVPIRIAGVGPERERLRDRVPANVEFVGFLSPPQRDAFYRQARCVVVPSVWYEPFGLAAAEPMAYGIPVIASSHGGLANVVTHDESGLLVESRNPELLAEKLRLLWSDLSLVERLGHGARARAVQEFHPNVFYQRLRAIYDQASALR